MSSTWPAALHAARAVRPRDAASLVILDHVAGKTRILIGRRRDDMKFAPGKYVFPGGRVDRGDGRMPVAADLPRSELAMLLVDMKGRPSIARARGLALAAIRETFEETGLLIGTPSDPLPAPPSQDWRHFLAHGHLPNPAGLRFFARAVTPAGRPRRFDARFFAVNSSAIVRTAERRDAELTVLEWLTLEEARRRDLHAQTRALVDDIVDRLDGRGFIAPGAPVPYYATRRGKYCRTLIDGESRT